MKNTFSKIIKELRLSAKLKQDELAKKLNTTQRKISYWESGKIEPDIDMLISISDYFSISIDELVGKISLK